MFTNSAVHTFVIGFVLSFSQSGWAQPNETEILIRNKPEKLLQAPVAADVLSHETIVDWAIRDIVDVANFSVGLQLLGGLTPDDTRLSLRGLGPTYGHPTVAKVIDGINYSSEALPVKGGSVLATSRVIGLERVEVIKGSQTTGFGPGAFAGAVQYITTTPSDQFESYARVEIGDYGHTDVQASLGGPLIKDMLSLGLSAAHWQDDGFYDNEITGNKIGGTDGYGLSLTSLLRSAERFSMKTRAEFTNEELEPLAQVLVPYNTVLPVSQVAIDAGIVDTNPILTALVPGTSSLTGLPWFDNSNVAAVTGSIPDVSEIPLRLSPDYLGTDGVTGPDFSGTEIEIIRLSNSIDWMLDFGSITLRSGYLTSEVSAFYDNDRTAVPGRALGNDESYVSDILDSDTDTDQHSQDLSFTSNLDGDIQFTLGSLWRKELVSRVDSNHLIISGGTKCRDRPSLVDPVPGCSGFTSVPVSGFVDDVHTARTPTETDRKITHLSIYGSVKWQINEAWRLTTDLRYVDEELRLTGPDTDFRLTAGTGIVNICGWNGDCNDLPETGSFDINGFSSFGVNYVTFERNDSYFAPKVILDWSLSSASLIYASFSATENPGGFNTTTIDIFGIDRDHDGETLDLAYEEEKMNTFELGGKKYWDQTKLYTTASLFFNDISDKLVDGNRTSSGLAEFRDLILQRSAEIWGAELEIQWQATNHLSLNVSYAFLESKFGEYKTLTASDRQIAAAGNCFVTTSSSGLTVCEIDQSGNELSNVPKHALVSGFQYAKQLVNEVDWYISGAARYSSERFVDDTNISKLDAYWLADLQVGLRSNHWGVTLYANNIFDDDTIRGAATVIGGGCCQDWRAGGAGGFAGETVFAPRIPTATVATFPDPRTYGLRIWYQYGADK